MHEKSESLPENEFVTRKRCAGKRARESHQKLFYSVGSAYAQTFDSKKAVKTIMTSRWCLRANIEGKQAKT